METPIEYQKINHAVDIFSEFMGKRMLHKADNGFTGWENPDQCDARERLLKKAKKIADPCNKTEEKDLLDLANFAMMIFMDDDSVREVYKFIPNRKV